MLPLITLIISLTALLATYAAYPAVMAWLAAVRGRPWRRNDETLPPVTMVVAAYNEAGVLEEKIANFLAIDYPPDRLFLAVGSDGSTDGTRELLARLADGRRIRAFDFDRGGKMKTVNRLVEMTDTPFLVFSDANTMYEPPAVRRLMQHFADETIGGVCGNLRLRAVNESVGGAGETTYWSFENQIKRWEGSVATTLGATGGIYAIRRENFHPQPEDTQVADDLLLPLRITADGRRVVYERDAVAYEESSSSMQEEFRRKVRVALTSFNCIPHIARVWPKYTAGVKLMLFFHKFLRWTGPFFLLAAAISIPLLEASPAKDVLLVGLLVFIALTWAGWIAESVGKRLGVLSLPFYFTAINLALLIAWLQLPFKRPPPMWETTARGTAESG